jgi:hypothetical protein
MSSREDIERSFEEMVFVLRLVPKGKKGERGWFRCPACTVGKVHWSRSAYNGHLWVACSTPDCVKVIQ